MVFGAKKKKVCSKHSCGTYKVSRFARFSKLNVSELILVFSLSEWCNWFSLHLLL